MMHRTHKSFAWVATAGLALTMACGPKLANSPETRAALEQRPALPGYNLGREGVAIDGYDPVAYFPEGGGAPAKGNPAIAESYQGVEYHFANEANRERFRENPMRYEPAYGGWCAYAMAKGNKIGIDPEAYLIQKDRLLLFYNGVTDTRVKWKDTPDSMLVDADINWRDISGECPSSRRSDASSAENDETTPGAPSADDGATGVTGEAASDDAAAGDTDTAGDSEVGNATGETDAAASNTEGNDL